MRSSDQLYINIHALVKSNASWMCAPSDHFTKRVSDKAI